MKTSTILTLNAYLNDGAKLDLTDALNDLATEAQKYADKANAHKKMYDAAKSVVLGALTTEPITVAALYEKVKGALPEGFTKAKIQYAFTNYWRDEINITRGDSKHPHTYSAKA